MRVYSLLLAAAAILGTQAVNPDPKDWNELPVDENMAGITVIIHKFDMDPMWQKEHDSDEEGVAKNHDFYVMVKVNDDDEHYQSTTTKYNTNAPVWDESLSFHFQRIKNLGTIKIEMYEDDNILLADNEDGFFVRLGADENKKPIKRKTKRMEEIVIFDDDQNVVGIVTYSLIVDDNLFGLGYDQECDNENSVLQITEPDFFRPLRGSWMGTYRAKYDDQGSSFLLHRMTLTCDLEDIQGVFNRVILTDNFGLNEDCSWDDLALKAQEAGAKGVIFHFYGLDDNSRIYEAMKVDVTTQLSTIPVRWIDSRDAVDIARTYDVHKVADIKIKISCAWKYEVDMMHEGMCVSDVSWEDKFMILMSPDKNGDPKPVVFNNHVVFVSTQERVNPIYMYVRNERIRGNYVKRWVAGFTLQGTRNLAYCQDSMAPGDPMEPNDCEHWQVWDDAYSQWEPYLYALMDFCEPDYDLNMDACTHTENQFEITASPDESMVKQYFSVVGLFGPHRYETPNNLEIVYLSQDTLHANKDGCDDYDGNTIDIFGNPVNVEGKLVIVSRGRCYFTYKQVAAEKAGAVAIIVVNYQGRPEVYMAHSGTKAPASIPIRMMQYGDAEGIRTSMLAIGANDAQNVKAGFLCPENTVVPPQVMCVSSQNSYNNYGFYNDFHGTYRRVAKDYRGHPVYRLDPLSNKYDGVKQYGTPTSGMQTEGIDHTHTFMYYDAGGVDDVGNAWKIGPEIGGGLQHVYAYCQGALGARNASPLDCEREANPKNEIDIGAWATYLPSEDEFYELNVSNIFVQAGVCEDDLTDGEGDWTQLKELQGILCGSHEDCAPNEFCLDCEKCQKKYEQGAVTQINALVHPCGHCFYERDPENDGDDGACFPNVVCSGEECVDRCNTDNMGIKGTCPQFPNCHEGCSTDIGVDAEDSMWGDGSCDYWCAGCPAWQQPGKVFDGGDCVDYTPFFTKNVEYATDPDTLGDEKHNLQCNLIDGELAYALSLDITWKIVEVDDTGKRFTMELDVHKFDSKENERFESYKLTMKGLQTPSTFEATLAEDGDDEKNKLYYELGEPPIDGIFGMEGTFGENPDFKTDGNPDGQFANVLIFNKDRALSCNPTVLQMQGKGKGGKEPGKDTGDDDMVNKCLLALNDKKMCNKAKGCTFLKAKKKDPQGNKCIYLADTLPEKNPRPCYDEDNPAWDIKGASKKFKAKNKAATNMGPCDCVDMCMDYWRDNNKPVYLSRLEKSNKKGQAYAECECFTSIKEVMKAKANKKVEVFVGSISPGLLDNWIN